eukprot:240712_1
MTANQELWQVMVAVPNTDERGFKILNGINRSHFIVIAKNKGLYRYDFDNNSWNKYKFITELPKYFEYYVYNAMAAVLDINTKTLYILNGRGLMAYLQVTDNQTNSWNITKLSQFHQGSSSQCVMIKNEVHLIGGFSNNKHLKYNVELNQFNTIHVFKDFENGFSPQLVSINNNVFIFGGEGWNKSLDTIFHYNIEQNKWNKLNVKMPKPLSSFGCTSAINNKYVLIFGGDCTKCDFSYSASVPIQYSDEIYVFSLLNKTFTKSKIACPQKGTFVAMAINDKTHDEMAVCGYIRLQWKLSNIPDHYFPPVYLLEIMHSYYLTEFVHLFDCETGKHWRMNTLDIVS